MASEFKTSVSVTGTNPDGAATSHTKNSVAFDQDSTKKHFLKNIQNVGTTYEVILWGDIVDDSVCCVPITNLSVTSGNDLLVSIDGTNEGGRIPPGQTALHWIKASATQKTNFKVKFSASADAAEVTPVESALT